MQSIKYRYLSLIIVISLNSNAFGQLEKLMNDDNVQWIWETKVEYVLEKNKSFSFVDTTRRIDGLITRSHNEKIKFHYSNKDGANKRVNKYMTQSLIQAIDNEELKVLGLNSDEQLSKEEIELTMTAPEIYSYLDELSSQTVLDTVMTKRDYCSISSYEIKQVWWYNSKDKRVQNYTTEIVPIIHYQEIKRVTPKLEYQIVKKELCRIIYDYEEQFRYDFFNEDNTWIIRNTDFIDLKSVTKEIKGEITDFIRLILWDQPYKREEHSRVYSGDKIVDSSWLQSFRNNIRDTIIAKKADSEYGYVFYSSCRDNYVLKDILALSVKQTWVYNEESNHISSHLIELGPAVRNNIKDVRDNSGNKVPLTEFMNEHIVNRYYRPRIWSLYHYKYNVGKGSE